MLQLSYQNQSNTKSAIGIGSRMKLINKAFLKNNTHTHYEAAASFNFPPQNTEYESAWQERVPQISLK